MIDALRTILIDGTLRLEPLTEADREPLRAACALDTEIWQMYFWCLIGAPFDGNFDMMLADPLRVAFAVRIDGALIGISSFSGISARHRTLEIGTTYLVPAVRGTGVNARMKRLMLDHAFACGLERVEFRVDVRNGRSQAAMARLGAVREGVARRHLVTWTGHVRDSAIFSILQDEWRNRGAGPGVLPA